MPADFTWDDASQEAGHLKAGFLGFAGSGKTLTATLLACATREVLNLSGPVAFFDTENGSPYVRSVVKKLTGSEPLIKRSRSFDDLMGWATACTRVGVSFGIVDSITHPWRELCDSYLEQLNTSLRNAGKPQRKKLEFQDWSQIKLRWSRWAEFYVNAPFSVAICGRAGWEYEMTKDEETGRKELNKVGIKMKTEGEFGFEPSLLVEMEAEQTLEPNSQVPKITRRATVLKDRFMVLDGRSVTFPSTEDVGKAYAAVKKFFSPHLALLVPGSSPTVDVATQTPFEMTEEGEAAASARRREREALLEEIENDLVLAHPDRTEAGKAAKITALRNAFGIAAWAKITALPLADLRAGREKLLEILKPARPAAAPAPAPVPVATKPATAAAPADDVRPSPVPAPVVSAPVVAAAAAPAASPDADWDFS